MTNPFGHLENAARTDVGRQRQNNEDAWLSLPVHGVFCVADGMGGAAEGEVASKAVVETVERTFAQLLPANSLSMESKVRLIGKAVADAAHWIFSRAKERGKQGTGTTFVSVLFNAAMPDRAVALHAGDSRLYLSGKRGLTCITTDHSLATLGGLRNEEDLAPMFRGVITRAVGVADKVELERTEFDVAEGDVIFLCSDGLSRMLPDARIHKLLKSLPKGSSKELAEALVAAANDAGGKDNITVNLIRVGALPAPVSVVAAGAADDGSRTSDHEGEPGVVERDTATGSGGSRGGETPSGMQLSEGGEVLEARTPSSAHPLGGPPAPPASSARTTRPGTGPSRPGRLLGWARRFSPRQPAGRYSLAGVAGALVLLGVLAAFTGKGEKTIHVSVAAPSGSVDVTIREKGAAEWTALTEEQAEFPAGEYEVRWLMPDYEELRVDLVLSEEPVELSPPDTWRPASPLAKLEELEQLAGAGRWPAVDEFFEQGRSVGLLENPANRRRWQSLRNAWRKHVEAMTSTTVVAIAGADITIITNLTMAPAGADVRPPVEPPAEAMVQSPSKPAVEPPAAPSRLKPHVLVLEPVQVPADAPPVSVAYREEKQEEWKPLEVGGQTPLGQASVALRFTRNGYEEVLRTLEHTSPEDAVVVRMPSAGEWKPTESLRLLQEAENALADGKVARASELVDVVTLAEDLRWQGYRERIDRVSADAKRLLAEQREAEQERLADARGKLKMMVAQARTNGRWGDVAAFVAAIGAPADQVFDKDDLRETEAWNQFRASVGKTGAAGQARAEYWTQVVALCKAAGFNQVPAEAPPLAEERIGDPVSSLCADIHAWTQDYVRSAVSDTMKFLEGSRILERSTSGISAEGYWEYLNARDTGDAFDLERQKLDLSDSLDGLDQISKQLADSRRGPITAAELAGLAHDDRMTESVAVCIQLWRKILDATKNVPFLEPTINGLLNARKISDSRQAMIQKEAAAVTVLYRDRIKNRRIEDPGQWLRSGGYVDLAELARKIENIRQSFAGGE